MIIGTGAVPERRRDGDEEEGQAPDQEKGLEACDEVSCFGEEEARAPYGETDATQARREEKIRGEKAGSERRETSGAKTGEEGVAEESRGPKAGSKNAGSEETLSEASDAEDFRRSG
jgi:hypothetical protein